MRISEAPCIFKQGFEKMLRDQMKGFGVVSSTPSLRDNSVGCFSRFVNTYGESTFIHHSSAVPETIFCVFAILVVLLGLSAASMFANDTSLFH